MRTIAVAGFACAISFGAHAADFTTVETSTARSMPVAESAGFDWNGFYTGIYGVGRTGSVSGTQFGLGLNAGVNAQFDFYLVGAEVAVQGLSGDIGETTSGQILGRAGLVVSDDVLLYGAGGYGIDLGAPDQQDLLIGGGVELAITDSFSLRTQYLRSLPVQGGNSADQITVGATFHF